MTSRALVLLCGLLTAADNSAELLRWLQAEGDYAGAAAVYRKLLAKNPESAELHSNLGLMLHMAGEEGRALEEFRQALRRNPSLVAANLFAGVCLTRLGRSAEAILYLDRACRLEPAAVAPRLARAQAYIGTRGFAAANKDYAEVVARDPSNAEGWFGMGITYRSMADALLKRSPQSSEASDYLQRALDALNRAIALDPRSERVRLILGEAFRDAGKLTESVEEYKRAIAIRPNSAAAHLGLATTYWKAGETETVLPALRRALELASRDPEANGIMADLLVRGGDYAGGRKHAEVALAGNPGLDYVHLLMGKIYLAENHPEMAVGELKIAGRSDATGSSYYLLQRAYKQLGRDADAAAALREFERVRKSAAKP